MKNLFIVAAVVASLAVSVPLMAQQGRKGGRDAREGKWLKEQIAALGWGEDGKEERVEPGDVVEDDDKDERLEAEAKKLGLEDKKIIKDFVKYAKRAWQKAEREDSKLAIDYKKHKDDADVWAKDLADHKEELAEVWADCDEDLIDKEVVTEDQLKEFKTNTKDLREITATMKSIEQDKIRERKIEELRKLADGDDSDDDDKKEEDDE